MKHVSPDQRRGTNGPMGAGVFLAMASGFLISTGLVCLVGLIG